MLRMFWRVPAVLAIMLVYTMYIAIALGRVPAEKRNRFRAKIQRVGCKKICKVLGIDVQLVGEVPEDGVQLAVCNHVGLLDTLVLASVVPVSFVAKSEVRGWPFVGWVCRMVGVIFVERDRRMQTGKFVEVVQNRMREHVRVLVFPEGTTSAGNSLLPFKTGAFASVAEMADGSILPLYLYGVHVNGDEDRDTTLTVLGWRNGVPLLDHASQLLRAKRIGIEVRVGKALPTTGQNRKELAKESQAAVARLLKHVPAPAL